MNKLHKSLKSRQRTCSSATASVAKPHEPSPRAGAGLHRPCTPFLLLSSVAVAFSFAATAQAALPENAAQIARQGNGRGAPACVSCHGLQGEGSSAFPRLAGTGKTYLQEQLDAFASGARKSTVMQTIAQQLSTGERSAMAAYYSKLPPPGLALPTAALTPANVGAWLANRGRWDDNLPACAQCHGRDGSGVGEHFPPLAGLPASYIVQQLQAWRSGARPPGPLGLMGTIASKLTPTDSQAVADYYGNQGTNHSAGAPSPLTPKSKERP